MSKTPEIAYKELIQKEKDRALVWSVSALLNWDERTHMPPGGAALRAEQQAMLTRLNKSMATAPEIGDLLKILANSPFGRETESIEGANVREIQRSYNKEVKIPADLVEKMVRAQSAGRMEWSKAYKDSDYSIFLPHLKKLIELKREVAKILGHEKFPYDALLDNYEHGATYASLSKVLLELKKPLFELLGKIQNAPLKPRREIFEREFAIEDQKKLLERVLLLIGFDILRGRLDQTVHPFCLGISPNDVRITTRYSPKNFLPGFFGALHEAGHGIYEQGLLAKEFGTPIGSYASLAIHESQSRLWENFVGRSHAFWEFLFPAVVENFRSSLWDVSLDEFMVIVNDVKPSFVRVEADEVTYNLHVILRFELEKGLINGEIKAEDLPHEWNEGFSKLFGMTPPNDRLGCLQDVHWAQGAFGYFPTYTLGNLYAAQMMDKVSQEIPDLENNFRTGVFEPLRNWLNKNVHVHGGRYLSARLCEVVTGRPLSPLPFLRYLEKKYSGVYGFASEIPNMRSRTGS